MSAPLANSFSSGPDARGHFGDYGGRYVAETLMPLILELERAWVEAKADPSFQAELDDLLAHYVGRPSPLYFAERLTDHIRASSAEGMGAEVWFKRDELNHTGAHKINNCVGQILLARRMGQDPDHRGDRGGPARGRHRDGVRRASVCRVSSTWARATWSVSSPTCSA